MRGEHGLFLVTSRRRYRSHEPGTRFEAKFDPALERAVQRGDIELVEIITPSLQPDSYRLPPDWPPEAVSTTPTTGRREAPLS